MKKLVYIAFFLSVLICIDFAVSKTKLPLNQNFYLLGFEKFRSHAQKTFGQKRIILLGGSSLGWGVSAEKLSSELGILTLNSGIYGGIGYKNFFRLIEDIIDKDNDILVISPEYELVSEFETSRNPEFCYIALYVNKNYPIECLGYSLNQIFKIIPTIDRKDPGYIRTGFNNYGDYIYRGKGKINMEDNFNDEICYDWTMSDLKNKYIPFIQKLKFDGYEIVYIPNFLAQGSCMKSYDYLDFHKTLFNSFGIKDFENSKLLYPDTFFYDTRYHLTKEGVKIKTNVFETQLKSYLSNLSN